MISVSAITHNSCSSSTKKITKKVREITHQNMKGGTFRADFNLCRWSATFCVSKAHVGSLKVMLMERWAFAQQ